MKKLQPGFIVPSGVFTVNRKKMAGYVPIDSAPKVGDIIYGVVETLGQHSQLENKSARIHKINTGTRAVFVFGNRYAPDYYEATIPTKVVEVADLSARSGVISHVNCKNDRVMSPTRIKLLGHVCDKSGKKLNTLDFPIIKPTKDTKTSKRSKLILVTGTAMNAGKSQTAATVCWALATAGYNVRASKVTGTASLKDILFMEDCGASIVNDFTHFGYPSTYMLSEDEILGIFNKTDLKYANNPSNFWVVEIADGILQRETAMLLGSKEVQSRIHKLVFAAYDSMGAIGGVKVLKELYGLTPDAISGVCSSSPLGLEEMKRFCNIPVFNNMNWDLKKILGCII